MYTFIYFLGLLICFLIFALTKNQLDYVGILSQGAILATFGAALMTISDIFERDKLERVKTNISILYDEIHKTTRWTRWPFLTRNSIMDLYDDHTFSTILTNPGLEFDVGSHKINIHIPTVLEDFFDLPVFREFFYMYRSKKHFLTKLNRDMREKGSTWEPAEFNLFCSFMCLYDSHKSACIFRAARILKHFSIALVFGSILMSTICIYNPNIIGCAVITNAQQINQDKAPTQPVNVPTPQLTPDKTPFPPDKDPVQSDKAPGSIQ